MEPVNDTVPTPAAPKTLGQVVHETISKYETKAVTEWHGLTAEIKAEADKFAHVIEAVVLHILGNQPPIPSAPPQPQLEPLTPPPAA
jgi:hypothetical protein